MAHPAYTIWIGTNSVRGSRGIYTVCIGKDAEEPCITDVMGAYNSGALVYDYCNKRLYAVSEGMIFNGRASGGVSSYAADSSGSLRLLSSACTVGQRPCSVALDFSGRNVITANFFGGSLAVFPVDKAGIIGDIKHLIADPVIPEWLHAMHCVVVLDDDRTLAALSVTRSSLVLYDIETGEEKSSYCFGEKVFVRSAASRGKYIYVMIQDPGDIYVINREENQLMKKQVVRMNPAPPDFYGTSALKLTPDGSLLLAGARRTNSIAVFRVGADGLLNQTDAVKLPGETPRDFCVSPDGKIVVTALQASDEICIHSIDYEKGTLNLLYTGLKIPSPAAVAIRKEEESDAGF